MSRPIISIIGASLAGLTAAYRLNQNGIVVDLYEALNRPGGRACTIQIGASYEELWR